MPISAIDGYTTDHWEEVREIIKEAIPSDDFEIDLVSNSDDVGIIQNRIVNNLYTADIVICDVSAKNPNVMFELGMRLAFDKPTIIIKDNKTNYSFDTSPIEHLEYPMDLHYQSIQCFKEELRKKTLATLEASSKGDYTTFLGHFGEFKIAKLEDKELPEAEFISKQFSVLEKQINNLSKSLNRNETSSRGFTAKEINAILTEVAKEYKEQNKIPETQLEQHYSEIEAQCIDHLINMLGINPSRAKYFADKYLEYAISWLTIPF